LADQNLLADLALDSDLIDIFMVSKRKRKGVRSAAEFLREHRKVLTDKVTYWSGVQRPIIKKLIESMQARVEQLALRVEVAREAEYLTDITVYATALAMNYLARGKFAQP
jgi:hypothetical protein